MFTWVILPQCFVSQREKDRDLPEIKRGPEAAKECSSPSTRRQTLVRGIFRTTTTEFQPFFVRCLLFVCKCCFVFVFQRKWRLRWGCFFGRRCVVELGSVRSLGWDCLRLMFVHVCEEAQILITVWKKNCISWTFKYILILLHSTFWVCFIFFRYNYKMCSGLADFYNCIWKVECNAHSSCLFGIFKE